MSDGGRGAAICDANVLIDYVKADEDIFRELVAYWGTVFVPDIVLFEARQLSLTRADELGLTIIETPLALPPAPGLSKADRACLYYVLERGWTCIVNDRRLRSECIKQGGTVVWGLEMLLILASERRITKARARRMATRIKADNPLITGSIIDDFIDKLKVL